MLTSKLRSTGKFVVIGDLMLDRYIFCSPKKISDEAPILVLSEECKEVRPGGAANVACKLRGLNYDVVLCGIIGDDADGILLKELLVHEGVDVGGMVVSEYRPTTVKTRIVAAKQQVVRVDNECCTHAESEDCDKMVEAFNYHAKCSQGVALIDYMKGVLSNNVLHALEHDGRPSIVDPRSNNWERYGEVTVIKPNVRELGLAVGHEVEDADMAIAARTALTYCKAEFLLVTLGADGSMAVYRDKKEVRIPTPWVEVSDVTGAGDAVAATVLAGLASGLSLEESGRLGNLAGSIVVRQHGVGLLTRNLLTEMEQKCP